MKNKYKGFSAFGIALGMWFSRNFGDNTYFGLNGRIIAGLFCALLIASGIIILIYKKLYLISFLALILIAPMVVMFIGIYYDNLKLIFGGLLTFIIILCIYLIIIKRREKKEDNIDYDKYKYN